MAWTSENIAAAEDPNSGYCWFVDIQSDGLGVPLRLMTGNLADITFSGMTFTTEHTIWGVLGEIDPLQEGLEAESPRPEIQILCPDDETAAELVEALDENTTIRWWRGWIDRDTGQPVSAPILRFDGFVDVPTHDLSHEINVVRLENITFAERFHDSGEGESMNVPSHQKYFPGELGFAFVNDKKPRYWGGATPGATGDAAPIAPPPAPAYGVANGVPVGPRRSRYG